MFRRFSINYALLSILIDSIVIAFSLAVTTLLRPTLSKLSFVKPMTDISSIPPILYILFPVIWVAMLMFFSVYDGRKNFKVLDEFTSLLKGSLLATVVLAGTLFLSYRDTSRVLFLTFILLTFLILVAWRLIARFIFKLTSSSPTNQQNVLIIGAGKVGKDVFHQIKNYPLKGIMISGFLDDDPDKHLESGKILGTITDAKRIIQEYHISDVIITLPQSAHLQTDKLLVELHHLPIKVWIIPDYFHLALHTAVIEEFAGLPMLDLRAPMLSDYQRMTKRAFDIVLTIFLLPFSFILGLFISLAIYLDDKTPIIIKQTRVGENGRIFIMYKFRTMVPEAEAQRHLVEQYDENGKLIHKTKNDPRVTKVGKVLRKTSLDELPQLINVLKGEMSLVGPRPELPYLVDQYEPWQRKRFSVPQGITGWWQIHGRSDKPMHLHTEDDIYYVQHYSLLLDIYILFMTAIAVFKGEGAY
jgi:exopolysaccharide biosynthesis polyprenyl glycosylphosphotransferase